jgi:hypothetical protein
LTLIAIICISGIQLHCSDPQYWQYLIQGKVLTAIKQQATELNFDSPARSSAAFDIDLDGDEDLIIIDDHDIVLVYENVAGGRLAKPPIEILVGEGAQRIAYADFDGDGYPDMAIPNQDSDDMAILFNSKGGNFGGLYYLDVGQEPFAILAADLNKDKKTDLLVTQLYDNTVNVYAGEDDGDFMVEKVLPVGEAPFGLALADLDLNGYQDILTANFDSHDISVLRNAGDFLFHSEEVYPVGGSPYDIVSFDYNNDGFPDAAVTQFELDSLVILLNDSTGKFDQMLQFATGKAPLSIAVADFDNNGWEDLVVTNSAEDSLSFYLNNANYLDQFKYGLRENFEASHVTVCRLNDNRYHDFVLCDHEGQKVRIYFDLFPTDG